MYRRKTYTQWDLFVQNINSLADDNSIHCLLYSNESSQHFAYSGDQNPFSANKNVCIKLSNDSNGFVCLCVCDEFNLNKLSAVVYNNFPAVTIHFDRYHITNEEPKLTDKIPLATN